MATQKVMDAGGHTEHIFDPSDARSVSEARSRFYNLIGQGYRAAALRPDGVHALLRTFDPQAESTLFIPPMQGG